MKRMILTLLRKQGMEITLHRGAGDVTVRGFFQPMTGNVERLALAHPGVLGKENRKRYVYIGPLEPRPAEQETLTVAGAEYHVRTVHEINGVNGSVYIWAMCVEKGRDA